MDARDRRILNILSENARTSFSEIARRIGITEAAVRKRIQKLERSGVILGYTVVINPQKTGEMISLTGIDVAPEYLVEVSRRVGRMPCVRRAWFSSGDHTIMAEVVCRNTSELEERHKRISRIKGVKRVCPSVLSGTIKWPGE